MHSIYEVERHPAYLAWLDEQLKAGGGGRTLLLAKDIDGALHYGVRLMNDQEFFVPVGRGSVLEMIEAEAAKGHTLKYTSKPRPEGHVGLWVGMDLAVTPTKDIWAAFREQHAGHGGFLVEVCACMEGGFTHVRCACGAVCEVDES